MGQIGEHWTRWRWCWSHGIVTFLETIMLLAIVWWTMFVGYRLGDRPGATLMTICVAVPSAVAYVVVTGWVLLDFDFFHGDVLLSSTLADMLIPILANDPYTSIGAGVYLATTIALAADPQPDLENSPRE